MIISPGNTSGFASLLPWRIAARLYILDGTSRAPPLDAVHSSICVWLAHIGGRVRNTCTVPPFLAVGPPAADSTSSRYTRRVSTNCSGFCTSPKTLTGGRLSRLVTRSVICGLRRYFDHALPTSDCRSRSVLHFAGIGLSE